MYKKFLAGCLLPIFLLSQLLPLTLGAVPTDGKASTWSRAKAEHLARRVLFYPTGSKVDELAAAGSASAAVDILFPSETGPDRSAYDVEMDAFAGGSHFQNYFGTGNFGWNTDAGNMYRYYLYRYYRDPYEAKAKLSTMFEDIYSVNNMPTWIEYTDIIHLHDLLYKYTLGNYKTLVKRALLNNPSDQGDYAASEFLNLLRQWNINNPNENYPREMLQLFLMGEYLPLESKDTGDVRNYSEDDVAALARIITGFWTTSHVAYQDDTTVFYTGSYHNKSNGITFLPGNTGGVNFPFYDSVSDTLDLSGMTLSVLGNNGLGDNTLDYIFAKRSHAIALFLANKLYHFYVGEDPTRTELDAIASTLESNNFEIFPTVKWLLVQDFFYSDSSMNAQLYYSPLELVIGLFRTLHARDPQTFDTNFYAYSDLLSRLGWTPYFPGSIFGRDGYDANYKWMSAYTITQWTNLVTTVSYDFTRTGSYQITNIVPTTQNGGNDISMDEFITQVEQNLLLSRPLPLAVKNSIKSYLTTSETGATMSFQPNNQAYREIKFPGVFALVLSSPEFILKSGYDLPTDSNVGGSSKIDNASGTLIVVELPGGYDWLNGVIEKSDYSSYASYRTDGSGNTIAHPIDELVDLGSFYLNKYLAYSGGVEANGGALKQVYDEGYLRIFNRVGTSSHSRDHDQAQRQITSIDNSTLGGMGLLGELSQYETNSANLFVMGTKRPNILQGGNYVNLGASDNRIQNSNPKWKLNTNQRNQQVNFLLSTMSGRTYPGNSGLRYNEAKTINDISNLSVAQGGYPGVGYTTASQLNFTKLLLDNNNGKIFYLQNTGNGYDTHSNELSGSTNLDIGIGKAVADITRFFESVKNTHNVTIVMFSEFGRTNAVNGTVGTDHGEGGGMFVLSNNSTLLTAWPQSIYGHIKTAFERSNWLSPGIDYRAVYGKIIETLYGITDSTFFPGFDRTLDDDITESIPKYTLLHTTYQAASDTRVIPIVRFGVEGKNFEWEKGSYIASAFSTGGNWVENSAPFRNMNTYSYWRVPLGTNDMYKMDVNDKLSWQGITEKTPYQYRIEAYSNQYIPAIYSGITLLPEVLSSGINMVATGSNSVLRKYNNVSVPKSTGYNPSGSGIVVANAPTLFADQGGIHIETSTGATYITHLSSHSTDQVWNGGFIIGERIPTDTYLPGDARIVSDGLYVSGFFLSDIIRVGSDVLGVRMQLSQPVSVSYSGLIAGKEYYVLTSENGHDWSYHEPLPIMVDSGGTLRFSTDHLSLFLLAEVPTTPLCTLSSDHTTIVDGQSLTLSWTTLGATAVDISPNIGSVTLSGSLSVIPPISSKTTYTLSVSNAQGSGSCHIEVESLPVPTCMLTPTVSDIKNGKPVTLSWTGSDSDVAYLNPGNRSVPVVGNITLTPPENMTTNYTISLGNRAASGSCMTSVSTYANSTPVATDDAMSLLENTTAFFPVTSNDTDDDISDIIRVDTITTPPSHGSATVSGTGILFSGTPGYCGPDTLSYRAVDDEGALSDEVDVTINISCGMNPPHTDDRTVSVDEDTLLSDVLVGTDSDGDTLSFVVATGTTHGSINLLSDGSYMYTPEPDYAGIDQFRYFATDGALSGSLSTVTIIVRPVNDVPVASSDSGMTNINTLTYIDILANDTDIDHARSSLTVRIESDTQSGALLFTGGVLEYTPDAEICGTDSFTYSLTDASGGVSDIATGDIIIHCISTAPIALPDMFSISEDTGAIIDTLANDTDTDFASGTDLISYADIVTSPTHGTITLTTSGSQTQNRSADVLSYMPDPDYCGTDIFTYRIKDSVGNLSNTAFVTINVGCINDAPSVSDTSVTGYANTAYSGILTAIDPDDSIFIFHEVVSVDTGTLSLTSSGEYLYTPPFPTFTGDTSFSFIAEDASGALSNTGTLTFHLSEAPYIYTYTGSDILATGSTEIFSGFSLRYNETLDLSGKTLSLYASSGTIGFLSLPGYLDLFVDVGLWSGTLMAPTAVSGNQSEYVSISDAGVSESLPSDTQTIHYTYTPIATLQAGAPDAGLALIGGYATVEYMIDAPGVVFGTRLRLLRSQDGNTWEANYPDATCMVDSDMRCTFRTNHLTYFGLVEQVGSPIVTPAQNIGPGGGSYGFPTETYTMTGLIRTDTGTLISSGTRIMPLLPGDRYAIWIQNNQKKYSKKYLAEKIYWDILKKNRSDTVRTDTISETTKYLIHYNPSNVTITSIILDLWKVKLAWKSQSNRH